MAASVIDLLADDAALARRVKADYHAPMTRDEYLSTVRGFCSEESFSG